MSKQNIPELSFKKSYFQEFVEANKELLNCYKDVKVDAYKKMTSS
jgi:hypothetical protein